MLSLLLAAIPGGAAPREDCAHAEVQRARAAASQAMARRDYEGAIKTLRALGERCWLSPKPGSDGVPSQESIDYFWVQSDLSLALLRAGRPVQCLRVLAPLTTSRPPTSLQAFELDSERVGQAILYNERQCQAAHERRFVGFSARSCPQLPADTPAVSVPAPLQQAGRGAACVLLAPPRAEDRGDATEDPDKLCPHPQLLARAQPGRPPRRSPLRATEGPLREVGECCNLQSLTIGTMQGKTVLRVQGGGRNCQGGTAAGALDALYEWSGDTLRLLEDNTVYEH